MKNLIILPLLALTLVACADKPGETIQDSIPVTPAPAATISMDQTPHVMGFEAGHALDSLGNIYGGVATRFSPSDTIFVSVRGQYLEAGAKIEAVLLRGTTRAATDSGVAESPDATTGANIIPIRFAQNAAWPTGSYQVEVFLNGVSQGLRPLDIQ